MANPRDNVEIPRHAQMYLDKNTGRTKIRVPAGGAGGGATSFVELDATEAEHVGFLKKQATQKMRESEALKQQSEQASADIKEHEAKEQKLAEERAAKEEHPLDDENPADDAALAHEERMPEYSGSAV